MPYQPPIPNPGFFWEFGAADTYDEALALQKESYLPTVVARITTEYLDTTIPAEQKFIVYEVRDDNDQPTSFNPNVF